METDDNVKSKKDGDYHQTFTQSEGTEKTEVISGEFKVWKDDDKVSTLAVVGGEHKAANVVRSEAAINGKILRVSLKKCIDKDKLENANKNIQQIRSGRKRKLVGNVKTNLVKKNKSPIHLLKNKMRLKLKANANKSIRQKIKMNLSPNVKHNSAIKANGQKIIDKKVSFSDKSRRIIKPNKKLFDFVDLDDIRKTRRSSQSSNSSSIHQQSEVHSKNVDGITKDKQTRDEKRRKAERVEDEVTSFLPVTLKANSSSLNLRSRKVINKESPISKSIRTRSKTIVKGSLIDKGINFRVKPIRRKVIQPLIKVKPKIQTEKVISKKQPVIRTITQENTSPLGPQSKINGTNKGLINKNEISNLIEPLSYFLTSTTVNKPVKTYSKIMFSFDMLVRHLKLIKLPAPNWKVRIMVTPKQQISEVTFSNKEKYERCVKFKRSVSGHTISLGGSSVSLLGAPDSFDSHEDVAVLLAIIDFININDPVVKFTRNRK